MKRLAFALVLAFAACDDDATAPRSGFDALEWTGETIEGSAQVQGILTIQNSSGEDVVLSFPSGCRAHLAAHVDAGRTAAPAWSSERIVVCAFVPGSETIPASGELELATPIANEAMILGDSLPDETYFMTIILDSNEGRVQVPAGSVHLESPE